MAKRRTKADVEKNDKILHELFQKYSYGSNVADGISSKELRDSGYIGSMPYPTPTATKRYLIRQTGAFKGGFSEYSIFKVF